MNEDKKIDDLLSMDTEDIDQKTFKKIKHGMNMNFVKRMLVYTLIVALVLTGAYFGINKLKELTSYNPVNEKIEGYYNVFGDEEDSIDRQDFQMLVSAYISVANPGVVYVPLFGDGSYTNLGSGNYEYYGKYISYLDRINYGESEDIIEVSNRRIQLNTMFHVYQFYSKDKQITDEDNYPQLSENEIAKQHEALKKDINNLPESAQVDISISFDTLMSFDQFVTYKQSILADVDVQYIATNIRDINTLGFSPLYFPQVCSTSYPGLCGDVVYTEEGLKEVYASSLKLLKDHSEFLQRAINYPYVIDVINDEVEKLKNDETKIYGIRLVVDKQTALKLLQNENTYYMQVFDAKFSPLQK